MSAVRKEQRAHTCNVCEAMCGMVFTVENGAITDARGDTEDVFSRGHICPKGPALREVHADPDRLRHPVRRTRSGAWQKVTWKSALDESADRLRDVQARHGFDAVGVYIGNPTVHHHGATMMAQGFLGALKTRNRFDANSQDANPKLFASLLMYGEATSITIPDVDRTDYFLMLGANPAASNGSVMSLGDVKGRLTAIRERGGKLVLVDPRRSETARYADEHHFIRPGSDALFLLSLLEVIFTEQRFDEGRASELGNNLAELRALASRFPAERTSPITGIAPDVVRRIARDFSSARTAVAYGRIGVCQHPFASMASWLVEALNVVTGNFDREGGAMFPTPAADVSTLARILVGNHYGRWGSRVRGLPEFMGQLPAAVMAEEMETAGEGQIRAFVSILGNPVLSTPNGDRLARALAGLDAMISVDFYINETSRHAHLILPGLHALERSHFDLVFHSLQVRNTVKYSEPVLPPYVDPVSGERQLDDWEILQELSLRLGGLDLGHPVATALGKLGNKLGIRMTPDRTIDLLLRIGPYGDRFLPALFPKGLNLERVRQATHGIDLGPLIPSRRERVRTTDGRVALAPKVVVDDIPRLERWMSEVSGELGRGSLVLIGRRHLRSNNSWMHNVHSLTKGPSRAQLVMHPDDAQRLGLVDDSQVEVESRVGKVSAQLKVSAEVMPGVVSLPHGYGHAGMTSTLGVAGQQEGPNVNALTDDQLVEPLLGVAILNGVPVTVRKSEAVAAQAS